MEIRSTLPGNSRLPIYPLRVARVDLGQSWSVWFLGSRYYGLFTRFVKGRGQYVAPEDRKKEVPGVPMIYKGYVSALVWQRDAKRWGPVCFEITERLELDLRGRYRRGQVWEISRAVGTKKTKQPPCRGQLLEERAEAETPPELDLVPCLRSFYHCNELDLDAVNPMPPITLVQAVELPGPGQAASDNPLPDPIAERLKKEVLNGKLHGMMNGKVG